MPNIKLDYLLVCENVFLSENKNLNIINTFNKVEAVKLPVIYSKFSIVTNFNDGLGIYNITIEIISPEPENKIITSISREINISKEGQDAVFTAHFLNVIFPVEGRYKIKVKVDGIDVNSEKFIIVRQKNGTR